MSKDALSFEDRHAAFVAGIDYGINLRRESDITEAVQDVLHQRAAEMLGLARHHAHAKGPAWEALVMGDSDE